MKKVSNRKILISNNMLLREIAKAVGLEDSIVQRVGGELPEDDDEEGGI